MELLLLIQFQSNLGAVICEGDSTCKCNSNLPGGVFSWTPGGVGSQTISVAQSQIQILLFIL